MVKKGDSRLHSQEETGRGSRVPWRIGMRGYGSLFVALCMASIAASVGAVLWLAAGLSMVEAALVALPILFVLMTLEVVAARARDRAEFTARIEGLARASAEIAREVGE